MDKKKAIETIEQTFDHAFDKDNFFEFIQNLLNDIDTSKYGEYRGNLIKEAFRDHITQYTRLGKYIDPNGDALDVLIIEVKDDRKLDQARTSLRNFVINHLKTFEKDYALAAFYSKSDEGRNWRFSFIKLENKTSVEEGKIKQHEELTPARRFSFLVGKDEKSHTAKRQLLPLLQNVYNNPLIEDLEKAFSIEVVTDEFFEQYKGLFVTLSSHFESDRHLKPILEKEGIDIARFTKKLLGQIVFLYFLQKKGWLGVPKNEKWGKGQKDFLQKLYDKAISEKKNFFNEYLQYLFYEALARQHGADNYYVRFDCRIPFLNGGLFESDYDWTNLKIEIPNELFRNKEKDSKTKDEGTGVLDVFDRYNFTIREDEPLEKEVAVDPEMLGKVFENMLEVTERKSKGAFYTPREIVHYMCQESLIHYLDNALNEDDTSMVPKEDIEDFVRKGVFALDNDIQVATKGKETSTYKYQLKESIISNVDAIDKLISNVKICDPAIGSGAFPVGLLNELVNLQLVLREHLSDSYLSQKLSLIGLRVKEYNQNPEKYTYRVKRHSIQESIYGVDIDASAIDIARLRLWLSLVVDEEDFDNIEALPNLDYKIVCGNSLIGLPETAMRDLNLEKELEDLKSVFFTENDSQRKKELRNQINSKIRELLDSAQTFAGYEIDFDFKLYFSEVWREKGGFDIVIGNPPYLQISKLDSIIEKDGLSKQAYSTFSSSSDLYELFYEQGNNILRKNSHLCYITSNKWMRANYGIKTRNYFSENTNPLILFDFGQELVFSTAIVHSNILLFQKEENQGQLYGCSFVKTKNTRGLSEYFRENKVNLAYKKNEIWTISSPQLIKLKGILENKGEVLSRWNVNIFRGVLTGYNKGFIIDEKTKDGLVARDSNLQEIIMPILRGRDVRKYHCNFAGLYIINTHNGNKKKDIPPINVKGDYPILYDYLNSFPDDIKTRADQGDDWTNLRNCAYLDEIKKEKIIFSEIVSTPQFFYDTEQYCPEATSFLITGENLKWLIALLNSELISFMYKTFYAGGELVGKYRYKKAFLEEMPLPKPDVKYVTQVEFLVDYLTFYKSSKENSKSINLYFENILDNLIYEILFSEEIQAAQKGVIGYLQDLKPIDDSMSDEEKLAVIHSEFERLYDPYHPVRNNVENRLKIKSFSCDIIATGLNQTCKDIGVSEIDVDEIKHNITLGGTTISDIILQNS